MHRKSNLLIIAIINLFSVNALSQEPASTDSLLSNQQTIIKNQGIMMDEVIYVDPLEGKKFGVEFNPVYFLISSAGEEGVTLTGGVSLFSISNKAEIAFPFYFKTGTDDLQIMSVDCHYRNFLGKHRAGFYISSGLRYTTLKGQEGYSFFSGLNDDEEVIQTASKFGLTFGIGYRKYGYNGWFWGTSLFGGKYFTDSESDFSGAGVINSKVILDMELLKIGKMF